MKKVLFICLGNICRSPMAEYILRDLAKQHGMDLKVESAGTSGWHDGENMHCGTAEILDGMRIDSHGFSSRKINKSDLYNFDYLIVMDDNNLREVEKVLGRHDKIFKITDLAPQLGYDHVPDPWYTGNFNETRDIILTCCQNLIEQIERNT